MTLPELTKVVQILTGEVSDMFIQKSEWGNTVWKPEHLRKDGQPSGNRGNDGYFVHKDNPSLWSYVFYDAEREAHAQPVRERIKNLLSQVKTAERELVSLYREGLLG